MESSPNWNFSLHTPFTYRLSIGHWPIINFIYLFQISYFSYLNFCVDYEFMVSFYKWKFLFIRSEFFPLSHFYGCNQIEENKSIT